MDINTACLKIIILMCFCICESLTRDPKTSEEISSNPTPHIQTLKDLIRGYKLLMSYNDHFNKDHEGKILNTLKKIEEIVADYDKTLQFIRLNGFSEIVYPTIHIPNEAIQQQGLQLIGTLVQNNNLAQMHALKTGSLDILIEKMHHVIFGRKLMYALGSLLRNCPLAQMDFFSNFGLRSLIRLFYNTDDITVKIKIVVLITDLVLEHKYIIEDPYDMIDKLHVYQQVNITFRLKIQHWWLVVKNLLIDLVNTHQTNHPAMEHCLNAVSTTIDNYDSECFEKISELVCKLGTRYSNMSQHMKVVDEDGEPCYYKTLEILCEKILLNSKECFVLENSSRKPLLLDSITSVHFFKMLK